MAPPRRFDHDDMLALFDGGKRNMRDLAAVYGVSDTAIRYILTKNGRVPRHPQEARDASAPKRRGADLAWRVLNLSPEARAEFDRVLKEGE